jgi:hypothetical protein
MTKQSVRPALPVLALALLAAATGARAEEARPPIPLVLSLANVPVESPEVAFRESLRSGPALRPSPEWVILPDGSARYGTASVGVIVKNPCPEGKPTYVPVPASGRR